MPGGEDHSGHLGACLPSALTLENSLQFNNSEMLVFLGY